MHLKYTIFTDCANYIQAQKGNGNPKSVAKLLKRAPRLRCARCVRTLLLLRSAEHISLLCNVYLLNMGRAAVL